MQIYAAMIDRMDQNIGRVIQALRDQKQLDNTVILFLSDNGAAGLRREVTPKWRAWIEQNRDNSLQNMGNGNSYVSLGPEWAQATMSPYALFKGFTTEGGIRSPLIIAGPGIAKNKTEGGYANLKDLTKTLLEVAHTSTDSPTGKIPLEGYSMAEILKNPDVRTTGPKHIEVLEMRGGRQVRLGDYKALLVSDQPMGINVDTMKPQQWQLFNIVKDPGETENLADKEPDILEKMAAAYDDYARRVGVVNITPVKAPPAKTLNQTQRETMQP